MAKKKKLKALSNALLSFQFLRDKEGTPKFVITSNLPEGAESGGSKYLFTGMDCKIFGVNFARDTLTDRAEKDWLCAFFDACKMTLEKDDEKKRLNIVEIYPNGMCCCFNNEGHQMPNFNGKWGEKKYDIFLADSRNKAIYKYGEFMGAMSPISREAARRLEVSPI